jgi:CHAT domain-containing protein
VTSFAVSHLPAKDAPAQATERLLLPIRTRLERAQRLRVMAYGALRAIDFHALPWDGQPLAARLPVEYPLDLPGKAPAGDPSSIALVITDPTLDLESARAENEVVVRALRDHAWSVSVLDGPRATSAAVLAALSQARLLHYAGHGVFAGREGWQSALPLANGGHLAIGDVLASTGVPARVVLSGCETARSAEDAPTESLGLAQSFIVAGAEFVIAPVRPVDDALAARMSAALYGGLAVTGAVAPAVVLREAQLGLRDKSPDADWSAFRVVTR